jgi:putative hydrolase
VSELGPFGAGGPLEDLMRNLARLFNAPGPVNWEVAQQFAQWAATGGQSEANVDPLARVRIEELLRVAELHVAGATGYGPPGDGLLRVRAVSRSEWAQRTLQAWRPLLERLAEAMAAAAPQAPAGEADSIGADPMAQLFGNLPQMLGPFLFGMQAGSLVGQLANHAMGQYDLPVPRPAGSELLVVPANIDGFATEWGLALDDVRLWVCLREVASHTVLGRPHVRERLDRLVGDYVGAFRPDTGQLEERLSAVDPTDLASLQSALGDPSGLLADLQNDEQRRLAVPLRSLLAVIAGYIDHVMERVGTGLLDDYGPITEALHRRRIEDRGGVRALGQLLGIELDAAAYERGQAFVAGVLERAGEEGLARLWHSDAELPTPPEVDAPGLWLARIDLPTD